MRLGIGTYILGAIAATFVASEVHNFRTRTTKNKRMEQIAKMVEMTTKEMSKDNVQEAQREILRKQLSHWTRLYDKECGIIHEGIIVD